MLEQLSDYSLERVKQELNSPLVQWTGIVIVLILLWFVIFQPYMQWRQDHIGRIQSDIMQLEKLQSLEQRRSRLAGSFTDIEQDFSDTRAHLLQSRSFNQALTEQVSLLESVFRPLKLNFGSRRFGEPQMKPWLGEQITSQWSFIGSSQQMLDFIYALAHQKKLVVPMSLELRKSKGNRVELNATFASYRYLPLKDLKFRSLQDQS